MLASDFVLGIGNRWANRHTGRTEVYCKGRTFVHVDIEPTQIGRVFKPDLGIVSDAKAALELFVQVARERKAARQLKDFGDWAGRCAERKKLMHRKTHYTETPIKPLRVYEEMNKVFPRDTIYVTTIGLSQIAGAQFLHVYGPRQWINCGQAGPLGWTIPAALGVVAADPTRTVVGLSGDYDFQFLIEELAVGAQFRLPYVQVLVNNSYLGLIRQSQRGFEMDFCVQLAFENQNVDDPALQELRRRPPGRGAGPGLQGAARDRPREDPGRAGRGAGDGAQVPRAGGGGGDPGEGDQHRDGHRDRQDQRVRGHRLPPPRRPPGPGDGRPARMNGSTDGRTMPRFAANLTMLFTEVPFLDRFERAAQAGFTAVEFLFPYAFAARGDPAAARRQRPEAGAAQPAGRRLGRRRARHRLPPGPRGRVPRRRGPRHRLRHRARRAAAQLPGRQGAGRRRRRGAAPDLRRQPALRRRRAEARPGCKLLIEPINTFDIPGFYLNRTAQALAILDEVGADNAFVQYDIYHAQRMEGELAATMQKHLARIGHIQLADNPGRNEPGTRRDQLRLPVRRTSTASATRGWIGCEYKPAAATEAGLGWRQRLARLSCNHA